MRKKAAFATKPCGVIRHPAKTALWFMRKSRKKFILNALNANHSVIFPLMQLNWWVLTKTNMYSPVTTLPTVYYQSKSYTNWLTTMNALESKTWNYFYKIPTSWFIKPPMLFPIWFGWKILRNTIWFLAEKMWTAWFITSLPVTNRWLIKATSIIWNMLLLAF